MMESRYYELLGQLLDGALSEADAEELRRELERDPDRLREVREHLTLSEILAQHQSPQRSADAFWSGVRSRLDTVTDAPLEVETATLGTLPARRRYGRVAATIAAGVVVAIGIGSQWAWFGREEPNPLAPASGGLGSPSAIVRRVSLHGEVVCAHCLLHQSEKCRPMVRVHDEGQVETIPLSDNAVCREFYRKEGCGRTPLPVLAEGTVRTENGRPLLAVTRLEVQR